MARRKSSGQKNSRRGGAGKNGKGAFLWVLGAVCIAMAYIYWQNAGVVNKTAVLEKEIAPTLQKFEIKEQDVVEKKVEKKKIEDRRYVHKEKVYKAPKELSLATFETKLKKDLAKSEFKVVKTKREVTKDAEAFHATINYGKFDVMDLKVVKPKPVAPPPPPPEPKRVRAKAKVAIVLDDFGYTMKNIPMLAEIHEPITLAVLPDLPFSGVVARGAKERGYEVILHMPLESTRTGIAEEADVIRIGMSPATVSARLARELRSVPGASGVSNHQGSKGTSEIETMAPIMQYLKHNDLFFLDSMTTSKSICRNAAGTAGVPYAKRDVFLDNSSDIGEIEKQIALLRDTALKKGRAVGIGHDRRNTLIALRRMIPKLREEGIEIVPVSQVMQ